MPGYELITPNVDLRASTEGYLKKVQLRRPFNSSIFIPTGLGVLITPTLHRIFAIYGAGEGNVYDLPSLGDTISSAQTSDVLFCGVTTARLGDFRLLTHAGGPDAVRRLTSRAFDLMSELGGSFPKDGQITVYS